jgi:GTPase SAR1 family protein
MRTGWKSIGQEKPFYLASGDESSYLFLKVKDINFIKNYNCYNMSETFKVVLLGDTNVGKTSILQRFSKGVFKRDTEPTVGAHFISKVIELP